MTQQKQRYNPLASDVPYRGLRGAGLRVATETRCEYPACNKDAWWLVVTEGITVCPECANKDPLLLAAAGVLKDKEAK